MTVLAAEALPTDQPLKRPSANWTLIACVLGAVMMLVTTALAVMPGRVDPYFDRPTQALVGYICFAIAALIPVVFSWNKAINDGQLARRNGAEPKYEHVSGWSALLLLGIVAFIAVLVTWAAHSTDANRKIHAEWGTWVVVALSVAFIVVAASPLVPRFMRRTGIDTKLAPIARIANRPIEWISGGLSSVDGVLVFAVANGAGTSRSNIFVRYLVLLSVISTCAVLGYYWTAPWAFIPIAWGFIVAFSVSRRWSWIEEDRELAMLNPTLSRAYIRVGFAQNLRDEALVVFLSMFLLVPLALRQAQLYLSLQDVQLFTIPNASDVNDLAMWVSFYGTELAKAVPFVDWAEVYHVEGDAPIEAQTEYALHAIFLTRVLIDLVFLAALLQAISAGARDAQQRDLFYRKGAIKRLDPFAEPDALKSLVRRNAEGKWESVGERFDDFPKYDEDRLVELSASDDERIARAADLLLKRDDVTADPHHNLSARAADSDVSVEEIQFLLDAIENAGPKRNAYQLALARRRLLYRKGFHEVRKRLVKFLTQSERSVERTELLIEALIGEQRESYQGGRGVALDALAPDIGINIRIKNAVQQVKEHDGAKAMREKATKLLEGYKDKA